MKKFNFKKIAVVLCALQLAVITASAAEPSVYIDDTELPDCNAVIDENDRTLIPVRVVSERMNCNVDWDPVGRMVTITGNEKTITIKIGENIISKNGEETIMDTSAQIIDDLTYIPARYLAEALGCPIEYDSESHSVYLYTYYEIRNDDSAENTNPYGYYATDFNKISPNPITDVWYEGSSIPASILNKLSEAPSYTAAKAIVTDEDPLKEFAVCELESGNYEQEFFLNNTDSGLFFTETLLKPSTDKIAVMIESEDVTPDDLWLNLVIYQIRGDGDDRQAFPIEGWHKTFEDKAVIVFDELDTDSLYSISLSYVDADEGMRVIKKNLDISGKMTIGCIE